ncbi:MAG TPA: class D sortase [Candidatus Eisenbacteria bacterium]|nr:class D sortase [Candidatus Eisenbacteria bacterium]
MRGVSEIGRFLLIFGVLVLGVYVGTRVYTAVSSRSEARAVENRPPESAQPVPQEPAAKTAAFSFVVKEPDFSLWSPQRIKHYQQSLSAQLGMPVALLKIPKIRLEVPVLEGTDDLTMDRAVGFIAGTARPGEDGNIGISGHRDGFFRGLKDIREGDGIELVSARGTDTYTIDRIVLVKPTDVSVLAPRQRPSVTLVTCYPFYIAGSAPKRYIVQASINESEPR